MILYPTETLYALGVNALDESEIAKLFQLKGREKTKVVSWLVRDIEDIAHYGELAPLAHILAETFLPGPMTLVLRAKDIVPVDLRGPEGTVSFRISPDPVAQKVIADFMAEHDAPLTCTSANVSGQPTLPTPQEIMEQFKEYNRPYSTVNRTIDDGPRTGAPSTVVRVIGETVEILRAGAISEADINKVLS